MRGAAALAVQALRVHAAHRVGHAHTHEAHHGAVLVRGSGAHGVGLRSGKVGGRHVRVAHDRGLLQVLDHLLVLFGRRDGVHAEACHLKTAQLAPLLGQHLVQGVGKLGGVRRHGRVTHAHGADLRERRLQRGQKLAFQLRVDLVARVRLLHVAAHVLVEHERVDDLVGVLAVAAHGDVHVKADVGVHHAERHRLGRAVLVAHDLLRVEEVHALILARVTAEGETRAHALEGLLDTVSQRAGLAEEQAGLGGLVEHELARLAACVHDGALLDDDHELALVHRDDGAVRDDVALALGVRAAALVRDALLSLRAQHVGFKRIAVEILAPRVGQHAACSSDTRFDQTHDVLLLRCCLFVRYSKTY